MENKDTTDITKYTISGVVPLAQIPAQQFAINLGGQNCTLAVFQKDEGVFVDLYKDDVLIFAGISALDRIGLKISEYIDFLGQLWFEDMAGTADPRYTEFGDRFRLVYGV